MTIDPRVEAAIRRAAEEDGVDPATALAYAERESSFNPMARASKTIFGLYQMRGDNRAKYGVGDSTDPYAQTKGFNRMLADNRRVMAQRLGRDPTDAEAYAGHHFGAGRAARMMGMDPNAEVGTVFTPNELAQNPHIVKAGTVGRILADVTGDIDKRRGRYGGGAPALPDFSQFGDAVDQPQMAQAATPEPLDFSQYGTAV